MIDYITAKFPCKHNRADIPQFKGRYHQIRLNHNAATIEVKSIKNGRFIVISGNPVKYLQGHNIFGSNDLQGLCRDVFALVSAQLGIAVNHEDQQAVSNGRYSLSRVDLAVNFRVPSNEIVAKIIREIEWHWRGLGRNVSNYGDETVYHDQHSKTTSTKLYNKGKEVRAHSLPEHILGRDQCAKLRRYAKGLVRAEFTLRSPALKKLELNRGSRWTVAKVKTIIQEKIVSLEMHREIKRLVLPGEYARFTPEQKQAYRLWLQGNDLRSLFEERTLHRRRKSLMEFGIDIRRPPAPNRTVLVSIRALLAPDKVTTFPKFAKRLGLIHLPWRRKSVSLLR